MEDLIRRVAKDLGNSSHATALMGAGISTESGLNFCLKSVIRKIKGLDVPGIGMSSPSEFCWAMPEQT